MRLVTSPADTVARGTRPTSRRDALLLGLVLCLPIPLLAVTGLNIPLPGGVVEAFVSIVPGGGDAAVRASAPASIVEEATVPGTSEPPAAPAVAEVPARVRARAAARAPRAAVAEPVTQVVVPTRSSSRAPRDLPAQEPAAPQAVTPATRSSALPATLPATQVTIQPATPVAPAVEPASPPADSRPAPVATPERVVPAPVDATPPPPPPVDLTPVEPVPAPLPGGVPDDVPDEPLPVDPVPGVEWPKVRLPEGAALPTLPIEPTEALQPIVRTRTTSGFAAE